MSAQPDTPLRDWLSELFDDDRRAARQARLRAAWEDSRAFLLGIHETLLDEIEEQGGDIEEAIEHVVAAYLDTITDELVTEADARLDWKRIPRAEVRAWLEERDGPFIRRLITVARMLAARKRTRKPASRLLTLLPGPVRPRHIIGGSPAGVIEADAVDEEPDEGDSGKTVVARLETLTVRDRRASRPAADLPTPPLGLPTISVGGV